MNAFSPGMPHKWTRVPQPVAGDFPHSEERVSQAVLFSRRKYGLQSKLANQRFNVVRRDVLCKS